MENKGQELILKLSFDTDEGLARAANFRSAIDADKEALAELNKVIKKNGEMSAEQLISREKLEKSIRENTRARADELRSVDNYIKATNNSTAANNVYNGSIKNMRASLSYLTEQWNGLSKAERENTQIGGVMQKEIKRLSDELKGLEGSVGDNRRSVGGYLDAIRQAPGAMGKFKAGINGISTAITLSPLGLLTTALQVIPQLMNSSGEGADFFAKAMSIMNAIVQEGLKRLVALGGAAVKLMSGDFKGAFADGKGALSGFTDSVNSAVKAGGALADKIDALENAESRFSVSQAKTRKEIDALLIQARNRTTAESDRIKLLEKAERLEVEMNKQALKLAKDRLEIIKLENAANTKDEDEEIKRLNEQKAKIIEIENESQNIQEKIQNRKDALLDAAAEREKKRHEDSLKRFEEHKKKLQSDLETFQKFIQQVKEGHEKQLEAEKKQKEESQKLNDANFANSEKARKKQSDNEKAIKDQEKKDSDAAIARKQAEYDAALSFASGTQALMSVLANENAAFAEFEKGLTLFKIGLASAEAITKGIAASQDLPFPGNLLAMAGTIAQVTANLIQAKQMIEGAPPKAPSSKFADGGLLDGPSHAAGGITGTGAFANVEVEGGEAIINKRSTALFSPILSAINQIGGGKPLAPTNYAAMGGILSPSIYSGATASNAVQGIDYNKLAKAVSNQPIYVIPTEIRDKANAADARKAKAGLGQAA